MSRLNMVNYGAATGRTATLLDTVKSSMGMVPNLTRVMANEPAVLDTFLSIGSALSKGSLSPKTCEAIALTVAGVNQCDYCASAHSTISKSLKVEQSDIDQHLKGKSNDVELSAILTFARQVVDKRGVVSDEDIAALRSAGYGDGVIAEVTANVAANIFTNYINHVAQTDIDFPAVHTS